MTNEITQETIVERKKVKPATKKAGMQVGAKKKTAIARATIKKGTGKVTINHINLNAYAQETL